MFGADRNCMTDIADKKLCSHCETGRVEYERDSGSLFCPYLPAYTSGGCAWFVEIKEDK